MYVVRKSNRALELRGKKWKVYNDKFVQNVTFSRWILMMYSRKRVFLWWIPALLEIKYIP